MCSSFVQVLHNMSDNVGSESWPSWKYVVVAAIPIAVCGAGMYYLYQSRKPASLTQKESSSSQRFDPEGSSSPQQHEDIADAKPEGKPAKVLRLFYYF